MKEVTGNIWDYHDKGHWVVIPTNTIVKMNGEAVMGKGLALQAAERFPILPRLVGERIAKRDVGIYVFSDLKFITFPTKRNWRDPSDIDLIRVMALDLKVFLSHLAMYLDRPTIMMPKVGCGAGQLDWADVEPVLEQYLPDNVWVISQD